MVHLSHLQLKNFKSLRNVDLALGKLNILIGPNGAGKSNLIKFFQLLREAANERLAVTIARMGGVGEVFTYQANEDGSLTWELVFAGLEYPDDILGNVLNASYFTLIARAGTSYTILEERIRDEVNLRLDPLLERRSGQSRGIVKHGQSWMAGTLQEKEKGNELSITVSNETGHPALRNMRLGITDWSIHRGYGYDILERIRDAQLLNAVVPLRIEPDGGNLVSVIYQMTNDPRYRLMQEQFNSALKAAFPEIDRLAVLPSSAGKGELHYVSSDAPDHPVPAISMSDGQLRFIGLAALLLLPDPPPLIAIDEPEIGLHPRLLPLLAELLKSASERTQVIVTTHSPQLLNAEAIDPLQDVILVDRQDGATTFERPDREKLERWLKHYSAGDLWVRGTLEALKS